MQIEMKRHATVNAPAAKSWRVIAHEFNEIDRWSSGIKVSGGISQGTAPEGAPAAGRYCDTVQEQFTYYDDETMRFGYEMVEPPWFIRGIGNNWSVTALGSDQSIIEMKPVIECHPLLGIVLAPLLKLLGGMVADRTFAEVAYYIEHDQPHPRKLKAEQKQMKVAS